MVGEQCPRDPTRASYPVHYSLTLCSEHALVVCPSPREDSAVYRWLHLPCAEPLAEFLAQHWSAVLPGQFHRKGSVISHHQIIALCPGAAPTHDLGVSPPLPCALWRLMLGYSGKKAAWRKPLLLFKYFGWFDSFVFEIMFHCVVFPGTWYIPGWHWTLNPLPLPSECWD